MKRLLLTTAAVLAVLSSCSPRLYPPEVETPGHYLHAAGFPQDSAGLGERWWELFGDRTLDTLVGYALANSPDLAAAAARVEQAQARLGVVRAQYLPQVGLGIDASGDYTSRTGIVQSYAVEPTLSWEVSLFGALRHTK